MSHAIYKVLSVSIVAPHTLEVRFDDGRLRRIDFSPFLKGELFGPLQNLDLFNHVKVDPEVRTLVWPNGADFDPETLHDWPTSATEVSAAVGNWNSLPEPAA